MTHWIPFCIITFASVVAAIIGWKAAARRQVPSAVPKQRVPE